MILSWGWVPPFLVSLLLLVLTNFRRTFLPPALIVMVSIIPPGSLDFCSCPSLADWLQQDSPGFSWACLVKCSCGVLHLDHVYQNTMKLKFIGKMCCSGALLELGYPYEWNPIRHILLCLSSIFFFSYINHSLGKKKRFQKVPATRKVAFHGVFSFYFLFLCFSPRPFLFPLRSFSVGSVVCSSPKTLITRFWGNPRACRKPFMLIFNLQEGSWHNSLYPHMVQSADIISDSDLF